MLKEVFASNAAKLVAACVCPIAAGTVALKVPPVRAALHKATAPKPEREARAKPRIRAPLKKAVAERDEDEGPLKEGMMCPQPVMLGNAALQPTSFELPPATPPPIEITRDEPNYLPAACGPNRTFFAMRTGNGFGAVPEPATWAQMVAGFALLGGTLRAGRRRQLRRQSC